MYSIRRNPFYQIMPLVIVILLVLQAAPAKGQETYGIPSNLNIKDRHFYDALTIFYMNYGDPLQPGAMTIGQCLAMAEQNSNELAIAYSRTKEAGFKIDQVRSAQNPTLSAVTTLLDQGPVPVATIPGAGSFPLGTAFNYDLKLTAQYLVTNFGLLDSSKKVAGLNYVRTKVDEARVMSNLNIETIKAYFTLYETKGFVAVAREGIHARETQYKIAKANYDEGVFPKLEVIRANVTLKQAQQDIISASKALELVKARLRTIMGIEQTKELDIQAPHFGAHTLPDLQETIDTAWKNRPEVTQMNLAVDIARTNIDVAIGGINPTLLLISNYDLKSESFGSSPSSWNTMLTLQVPIFDGGATWSKVQQSKEVLTQNISALDQLKRDIALQVKNAHIIVMESQKRMETEEANLEQAKEAYDITLLRYQEGIGTNVELDNALVSYLQSHSTLLQAFCSYQRAWADLLYSMGLPLKGVYNGQ